MTAAPTRDAGSYPNPVPDQRRGLLLGVTAYVLWGVFPLYFPLLEPAGAFEILAHRILWSALTMGLLVLLLRRTTQFRALLRDRRTFTILCLASVVISINWVTYIWFYNHPANGQRFPKVQLLSVQDLLDNKKPNMPTALLPYFQAQRRYDDDQTEKLF